jgi:CheY-like chemotaxis protein
MHKKVMLVEDDPDDQELFQAFLGNRSDISLLPMAGNGIELLAYLEEASETDLPDLIILDQNMPKMSGKQTLEALKAHARFGDIPTVIYSTYTDSNLILECQKLGARMVAMKPIDQEGYHKMLNDFLLLLVPQERR